MYIKEQANKFVIVTHTSSLVYPHLELTQERQRGAESSDTKEES